MCFLFTEGPVQFHTLFFNMEPKEKKKIKCAASFLRYISRLKNLDGCRHTALGLELAWAGAPVSYVLPTCSAT